MESKVFAMYMDKAGEGAVVNAHMSLTLVLIGNLPVLPTTEGGEHPKTAVLLCRERPSLPPSPHTPLALESGGEEGDSRLVV